MDDTETTDVLAAYAAAIDTRDWEGLRALLAPDFRCTYLHSGEFFDRDQMVRLNSEYPGEWRFLAEEIVVSGERGVLRARIIDASGESEETHVVATFATVRVGMLVEATEVWAEVAGYIDPARRPAD